MRHLHSIKLSRGADIVVCTQLRTTTAATTPNSDSGRATRDSRIQRTPEPAGCPDACTSHPHPLSKILQSFAGYADDNGYDEARTRARAGRPDAGRRAAP